MFIATLLRPGSFFRERNCERSLEQSTLTEERNTDHTTGRCRKRCDTSYQNSERSRLTGHPQRLARPSPRLASAGALVKASPIIRQKGDTFRALLIIQSKQSGQSRRATAAEEDASAIYHSWLELNLEEKRLPIASHADEHRHVYRTVQRPHCTRPRSQRSSRVAGVRILDECSSVVNAQTEALDGQQHAKQKADKLTGECPGH